MYQKHKQSARVNRPFVGIPSFLRSQICSDIDGLDADIAIIGVPTDEGSPYMPGARFGPRAIREQSMRFASGDKSIYDPQSGRTLLEYELSRGRIADAGDVDILPTNVVETFHNVTNMVRAVLDRGALPVVLGGDHSIAFPIVRAFDGPIFVVQLDAHLDYARVGSGLEFTNGHPFRHIRALPQVQGLIQVGIRSLRGSQEMLTDSEGDGNWIITMDQFRASSVDVVFKHLPNNSRCYVSIDIDVLDSSLVPGCVSAEPDGMSYRELRTTLAAVAKRADIVGFDLVEVNPQLDVATQLTSYIAAHTIVEFLGNICDQPRHAARRKSDAPT